MPSKRLPELFADETDILCSECGEPRPVNRHQCPHCTLSSACTPDKATIGRRAAAIRAQWPAWRWREAERQEPVEIPVCVKVTDHMRRRHEVRQ